MATSNTTLTSAASRGLRAARQTSVRSQSRPRVLQVVLSLNPGGTERLVLEIVRRLAAEIPMAVCCLDAEGDWARDLTEAGISVSALRRPDGFAPSLGGAVVRAASAHNATVLHCHHYSPFVYGALARLFNPRLRIVFTEHGRLSDAGPSAKRRLANRVLSWFPDEVYTVSGELRSHIVEEGFPSGRVGVIYNGIAVGALPEPGVRQEVRNELGASPDTFLVGTVANFRAQKDYPNLLAAARLLADRSVSARVVAVGQGPQEAETRALHASLDLGDRVLLTGRRDDAVAVMGACDAFVMASSNEGLPVAIMEALALGLPVVSTAVGGIPEAITDGVEGLLVPARDPEALAGAITRVATDPTLRAALARGAAAAGDRYDITATVRRIEAVYAAVSR